MKYSIWDKVTPIITPIGEILSPGEWISRYPVAEVLTTVCSYGEINGGFFGVLSQMVQMYEEEGADFSSASTDEEKLLIIEAWEDKKSNDAIEEQERQQREKEEAKLAELLNQTRIADALEDLAVLSMPDVEE